MRRDAALELHNNRLLLSRLSSVRLSVFVASYVYSEKLYKCTCNHNDTESYYVILSLTDYTGSKSRYSNPFYQICYFRKRNYADLSYACQMQNIRNYRHHHHHHHHITLLFLASVMLYFICYTIMIPNRRLYFTIIIIIAIILFL